MRSKIYRIVDIVLVLIVIFVVVMGVLTAMGPQMSPGIFTKIELISSPTPSIP